MKLRHSLAVLTLVFLAACSGSEAPTGSNLVEATAPTQAPSAMKPGDYVKTLSSGGIDRTYILHVPASYDGSKALPVVLAFHGLGGNAKGMVAVTQFNPKADEQNFIAVYPNGTGDPQGWNAEVFENPLTPPQDDLGFVRALVQDLEGQLNVDNKRIYAAGFSNGGIFAHLLASQAGDLFAGVAVVEGSISTYKEDGSLLKIPDVVSPIPIIMFHGKNDKVIPFEGGQGKRLSFVSIADDLAFWKMADHCTGDPSIESDRQNNKWQDWILCATGAEVEAVSLENGEHQWPTSDNAAVYAASDEILKFFFRHSK